MHTPNRADRPARQRPAPLPVPDVIDSDFGAFTAALHADDLSHRSPAADAHGTPAATQLADALLAEIRREHTDHGYTSWPAYADALEVLVRQLLTSTGTRGL